MPQLSQDMSSFKPQTCVFIKLISATGLTRHAVHHKLPNKKKQLEVLPLVSCFSFYGHSMESLSAIKLYGQLMTLMVLVWFSIVFHVFPLWYSMKLLFSDYGFIWNSCSRSI